MVEHPREIAALQRVLSVRGISRHRVRALVGEAVAAHGSIETSVDYFLRLNAGTSDPEMARLSLALREARNREPLPAGVDVVGICDPRFPSLLRSIPDPPLALFVRGNVAALEDVGVAIVGSRRCTPYGRLWARSVAGQLAAAGALVVSGLAYGIDAAAHTGALDVGARTLAVLGSGVDCIYPARHRGLAAEILQGDGAIVSEYLPGVTPRREHFPERNRIVSGLSAGVVVVEASDKSGSLITARLGLEQGREVMAVPGPVAAGSARGCHRLLKDGAALVEDAADVLNVLGWTIPERAAADPMANLGESERRVVAAIGAEVTSCDQIVQETGLETQVVLEAVTILEVEGFVEACHGGYIRRPF